ncbi:MAG: YdeI/OmpD-associated family protein, partial [Bacteroidia bacterium]|nr:YdeI/OmpD-associated family protein [Bacteroidia bacterium]
IPKELEDILKPNLDLKKCFDALSPYKQREYCEYIGSAKRESTKQTRLDKIIPMILEGKGLNDKYKNC